MRDEKGEEVCSKGERVCYWGVYRGSCYVCVCAYDPGKGDTCWGEEMIAGREFSSSQGGVGYRAQVHFGLRSRDSLSIVIGEKAEMQVGPWI